MQGIDWVSLFLFIAIVILLVRPVGSYIYKVLNPEEKTFLDPVLKPLERLLYRWGGIDPLQEQKWTSYLFSILTFSLVSLLFTIVILGLQYYLPLNPMKFHGPFWHLNLNTSVSFMTNTNFQSYEGEITLSYFSQMVGLAVQNFVSPSVGLAAAAALVRGISRKSGTTIGNFWCDLVRVVLYLFLPLSVIVGAFFISQGVPENFHRYVTVETLEGRIQTIPEGPIASQEAIKLLGSNGGGFMGAGSAHPYENPTPFVNFFQMLLIFLIPAAQIYYYGLSIQNTKHAWCIFAGLFIVFIIAVFSCTFFENVSNPAFRGIGLSGGNFEGKEMRCGIFPSAFYACVTTAVSCGSMNCSHEALTPLGGLIPLLNMQVSEVIFGGAGAGLYGILLYVLLAIFITGLIIGRTPEYLGNKIKSFDMKMVMMGILPFILVIHVFTAWASCSDWGLKDLESRSPHGFTEMLYDFSSATANNGSSLNGLNTNTAPYNVVLAIAMIIGRFIIMTPIIALAGSLVQKKVLPKSVVSFPVSSFVFITLFVAVIFIVGVLTFLPALTMGPVLEQFYMYKAIP